MRGLIKVIIIISLFTAIYAVADYLVTGQPQYNAARILSLRLEFKPKLWAIVKSQNLTITNAVAYEIDWLDTNIVVTSNYQVVAYESPTIETHMSTDETKALAQMTIGQLGLTTNDTVQSAIDLMIRTGMQAKGLIVTNGQLL